MQRLTLLCSVFLLAACTGMTDPSGAIVDLQGVDRELYEADLADCKSYADEVPLGKHVGGAAVAGAAVGAAVGVISGDSSSVAEGAGYGAVYGGTMSGGAAIAEKRHVLRECMRGRGYRVLN